MKEDLQALRDEKMHLQHQLEEERVTSDGLQGEVAQLRKQAKVESTSRLQMSSLAMLLELHGGGSFTLPQDQIAKSICIKAKVKRTLITPVFLRMNPQVAFDSPIIGFHIFKVSFLILLKLYEVIQIC